VSAAASTNGKPDFHRDNIHGLVACYEIVGYNGHNDRYPIHFAEGIYQPANFVDLSSPSILDMIAQGTTRLPPEICHLHVCGVPTAGQLVYLMRNAYEYAPKNGGSAESGHYTSQFISQLFSRHKKPSNGHGSNGFTPSTPHHNGLGSRNGNWNYTPYDELGSFADNRLVTDTWLWCVLKGIGVDQYCVTVMMVDNPVIKGDKQELPGRLSLEDILSEKRHIMFQSDRYKVTVPMSYMLNGSVRIIESIDNRLLSNEGALDLREQYNPLTGNRFANLHSHPVIVAGIAREDLSQVVDRFANDHDFFSKPPAVNLPSFSTLRDKIIKHQRAHGLYSRVVIRAPVIIGGEYVESTRQERIEEGCRKTEMRFVFNAGTTSSDRPGQRNNLNDIHVDKDSPPSYGVRLYVARRDRVDLGHELPPGFTEIHPISESDRVEINEETMNSGPGWVLVNHLTKFLDSSFSRLPRFFRFLGGAGGRTQV